MKKPKKFYTVKCRIPAVSYVDVYLYATSETQAKANAKAFMKDGVDTDVFDSSGDYDEEQDCRRAVVESVTCDENDVEEVA